MSWSLRAKPGDAMPATCEICGTALKLERRRPGRRFRKDGAERRDFRRPPGAPARPA